LGDFSTPRHLRIRGAGRNSEIGSALEIQSKEVLEAALNQTLPSDGSHNNSIPSTTTPIFAIASIGRAVGATSLAISIAAELQNTGSKVLLIDGHLNNPNIARHFRVNGIRVEVKPAVDGFDIYEATTLSAMQPLSEISRSYQYLVLDLGEIIDVDMALNGRRRGDLLTGWAIKSQAHFVVTTSDSQLSIAQADRFLADSGRRLDKNKISRAIIHRRQLSNREKSELSHSTSSVLPSTNFSYDPKALMKMAREGATLVSAAPRSIYRREVERFIESAK
jgi:hypothetical protein